MHAPRYRCSFADLPVLIASDSRTVGSTITRVAYGIDASSAVGRAYLRAAEDTMDCFNTVFRPGRYLVQILPWLRYVPAWVPGAGFQRDFARWRPVVREVLDGPWAAAKEKRVRDLSEVSARWDCLTISYVDGGPGGSSKVHVQYVDRTHRGWTRG